MNLHIRDVQEQDLDGVLALNNAAGPGVLPIDSLKLGELFRIAAYFRVALIDGHLAGFLIALDGHSNYHSPNFAWFKNKYTDFVYIDRIVIARPYRGHGLGRIFYCDVQSYSEVRSERLTCEVFLEPRDDVSVLFHGTFGFREVGQQTLNSGHRVSLLAKELCSYPWVRDAYEKTGLPNLTWLRPRIRIHHDPVLIAVNGH
jgi:predicted GNAT superfamily acetyltransferase